MIGRMKIERHRPASAIDPFAADYLTDPYPFHRELRALGPLVWLDQYGVWCVTRHKETLAVLANPKLYCSGAGVGITNAFKDVPWRTPSLLLEADAPAHKPRRRLLHSILSGESAATLRAQFEITARAVVDRVLDLSAPDGVRDVAQAYILKAFPVGLAETGRENLLPYGAMVFNGFGPRNAIFEASLADVTPRLPWIMAACKRENLKPGGLGERVYQGADAGDVTHDEALLLLRSFLSAGLDTTVDAIGGALHAFAAFPDQWAKLRANPSAALIRNAFEEVLRYHAPLQTFFRTTTQAVTLAGVPIVASEKLMLSMGCANRDPDRWARPDEFDIERRVAGHLGFGAGVHGCVGQIVARLEVEVLLTEMVKRVAAIELAGPAIVKLNNAIRGFASLPVRLTSG